MLAKTHKAGLYSAVFTPDGRHLLLETEKQVQVWEVVAGSDSVPGMATHDAAMVAVLVPETRLGRGEHDLRFALASKEA